MSAPVGPDEPRAEVSVRSGTSAYSVLIERGLRHRLPGLLATHAPAHRYAVISDSNVAPLYGEEAVAACRRAGLAADLFTFPAGEENKTRQQWSILTDLLLQAGLGRDAAVVAVGGGVTGDLAGFVAATFLRGVPVVQVPTSLVAMVDASVGGKTGVDVRAGKNLVGAFHPPRMVLVDPETVATLPVRERAEGLAEAVKHGAVSDEEYFEDLVDRSERLLSGDPAAVRSAVVRSVQIKAGIVSEDEREGGVRQILNFGHTYGHALEAASGYRVGHGTAVAAGMVLEARLGERAGITEAGTARRIESALSRLGLGQVPPPEGGAPAVLRHLATDKKTRAGETRFVLLTRVGVVDGTRGWSRRVEGELVAQVLEEGTRDS
ncbi:MAG: 3-dehydroquinate synthase [Longimicrobiales bacterium]|nr:3-dehydroquinate synthase [Longimicrobiales bacterium]